MDIFPLSEGSFTVDRTKEFVPFNKQTDNLLERPTGSILVEVQPFLVRMKNELVLLDTGLGFKLENGNLQLHQNILKQGFNPSDVTLVLLSHLHKDHAGGIQDTKNNAGPQLSFPQATYYVNRQELTSARENKTASYIPEDFTLLGSSTNTVLLDDSGTIDGYIHYEMSGAHCPYHTVYRIVEGDETIFFGGDVAPQLQQMKNRLVAKYDFDGRKSMELRTQWWERGKQEHWIFLFYHDIKTPTFTS